MKKQYFLIVITILLLGIAGYIFSHPQYETYERRHRAAFIHIQEENYRRAEWDLHQAIKLEPYKLDGYATLYWFYWNIAGESDIGDEIKQKALDMGFDAEAFDRVKSAYSKMKQYNAVYMTNADDTVFTYYGYDGDPKRRDEIYSNGSYLHSKYNYENGRIISETFSKHEGIYTWPSSTMEYIYDEQGRLIQKNDPTRGWIKYYYDDNGAVSLIDYQSRYSTGNGKTPYKEFYENGVLVKTLSSKGNNTFDTETYYNPAGQITQVNSLAKDGNITQYAEYSYSEENGVYTEEIRCYYTDGVLDYLKRKITDSTGIKTITDKYNTAGKIVKTTEKQKDKEVISRPYDSLENARKLTGAEIELINTKHPEILIILNDVFDLPEEMDRDYLVAAAPKAGTISDKDKAIIQQLRNEGVNLNYNALEIELAHYIVYDVVKNKDVEKILSDYVDTDNLIFRTENSYPYSAENDSFYISRKGNSRVSQAAEIIQRKILAGEINDKYVKLYADYRTMIFEKMDGKFFISAVLNQDNRKLLGIQNSSPQATPVPSKKYKEVRKTEVLPQDKTKGQAYNTAIKEYNNFLNTEGSYGELPGYRGVELYDLTKDGIPELILPYDFGHMSVYSWMNGKLTELEVPAAGGGDGGKTILKNGIIQGTMHKIGYKDYEFYTYNKDGSANKVSFGIYRDYENDCTKYKINGQWVSREEYNIFIQPYRLIYNDFADIPGYPLYEEILEE